MEVVVLVDELKALGVRGILIQMARNGQLLELRCEMPMCYREREDAKGRTTFDPWPDPKYLPANRWAPNPDHYPQLKRDGGKLTPWNVRLAHVYCNSMDYSWRARIRSMLEKTPTLGFEEIADRLNGAKTPVVPPDSETWTAKRVREAYVS
jgi:hypothetical protein